MTRPRSWLADLSPLRRPAYRRLWAGSTVSLIGSEVTVVSVQVQVYGLTHSSLDVGLIGLFALAGLLGFGLTGGAIADAHDRRRVGMIAASLSAVCSAGLAVQAALHNRALWILYLIVFAVAALLGVLSPTQQAILPRLLPADELPAGNALTQMSLNLGFIVGPLLAGLIISTAGLFPAYLVDAGSFVAVLYAFWRLPSMRPQGATIRRVSVHSMREGVRYFFGRQVLYGGLLVDLNAVIFGRPQALFPAIAADFFHGGAGLVGVLNAAPAIGALAGAGLSGRLRHVRRQGLTVLMTAALWGAAIAAFGLSRSLPVSLLFLALAGAADMVSAVLRNTIVQVMTPDAMRGRIMGVYMVMVTGGPQLGDVEAGAVARLAGPGFSAVSGGVAAVAGVIVLAFALPKFTRYRAQEHPPAGGLQP